MIEELQKKVGKPKRSATCKLPDAGLRRRRSAHASPTRSAKSRASPASTTAPTRSSRSWTTCSRRWPRRSPIPTPATLAIIGAEGRGQEDSRASSPKSKSRSTREAILAGVRPDGRGFNDIRPITCEVGVLPRVHGSAVFTRGETQAMCTVTLGTSSDEQMVDGLIDEYSQKFMLHYNFPSYSVGEVRPIRGPGRREIGHGALAERSADRGPARRRAVPLHRPRHHRHPRIQRLQLDGLRLRRMPRADGRRRADHQAGRRHLGRPGPGRRQVRAAHRHHRRGRPLRRHGLQGLRHHATASPPSSSTSRSKASRTRSSATRCTAPRKPGCVILDKMAADARRAAHGDQQVRPAPAHDQDRPGEDRQDHRPGRQEHQSHPGRHRRQHRHRGRRHGLHLRRRRRRRREVPRHHRGDDRRGEGRQDLQRQGRQHQGLRRVRRDRPGDRRPVPRLRAVRQVRRPRRPTSSRWATRSR